MGLVYDGVALRKRRYLVHYVTSVEFTYELQAVLVS